jgi:dethiobiotin synthetase
MKQQTVYFVTGTETDVGKTYVSELLLKHFTKPSLTESDSNNGLSAIGYKPVAAGASLIDGQLQNEDAIILRDVSQPQLPYSDINPVCYKAPIAPHIASKLSQQPLTLSMLNHWWINVREQSDIALIEGAGGWRLPLNDHEYLSDFVQGLACEVIVVVGMKLGCLSHALLTIEAIKNDGLVIKGWVANQLETPMDYYQENLSYLKQAIDEPLLAEIKSGHTASDVTFITL